MQKTIHWLFLIFLFLIPIQLQFIYFEPGNAAEKWQYETMSVFASEVLLGAIIVLSLIQLFRGKTKDAFKCEKEKMMRMAVFGALFCLLLLNCVLAINSELAFYRFSHLILAASVAILTVISGLPWEKLAASLFLSGLVQAFLAFYQFAVQSVFASKWLGMAAQSPETLGVSVIEAYGMRLIRAYGTLPHPNILAGFLVVSLFAGIYLAFRTKKKFYYLTLAGIGLLFIALCLTFSRAGMIAFGLGFLVSLVYAVKNKIKMQTMAFILSIVLVITGLFATLAIDLFSTRITGGRLEALSSTERQAEFMESVPIFEKSWLFGTGLGNYTLSLKQLNPRANAWAYQPPHNFFWLMTLEAGILISLFFLSAIGYFVYSIIRKTPASPEKMFIISLLSGTLALCTFDHYLWSFWAGMALFGIIVGLGLKLLYATPMTVWQKLVNLVHRFI